jgi:prepilin-type N-terminal cleavage/methylation domain-containing protein
MRRTVSRLNSLELTRNRGGFTLVEILIVVVILGILAALVVPQFASATDEARQGTFVSDIRSIAQAAQLYMARTGQLLPDSGSGTFPNELDGYIDEAKWLAGPSIGGQWDIERGSFAGMSSGFGVHFNGGGTPSDEYMEAIDAKFDDGSLTTGAFRQIDTDRFYYVLLP